MGKMKRGLKKFGAFLLTAVMALAMNSTVFAAGDMTGEGGVIGEFANPDTATVQDTSVKLYKEITALNPETCVVNAPTITYTYTVTAGDADKEITDASSHHAQINGTDVNVTVKTKAGVGSPVITGTTATNSTTGNGVLEITPADKLDASQYGTANRFEVLVDFNAIDFTTAGSGAGVYRYEIAETCTTATKNAAGISEGSVANTLYMDVYVDGDGKIYGYVLFTENDDIVNRFAEKAYEADGFVFGSPVYYAHPTGRILSFLDRVFYSNIRAANSADNAMSLTENFIW